MLENNEYFRNFIEHDRSYVTDTFRVKEESSCKFALHQIKVNTISDIGFISFG